MTLFAISHPFGPFKGGLSLITGLKICKNTQYTLFKPINHLWFTWFFEKPLVLPQKPPKITQKMVFSLFFWRFFGKILSSNDVLPSLGHGKHRIV